MATAGYHARSKKPCETLKVVRSVWVTQITASVGTPQWLFGGKLHLPDYMDEETVPVPQEVGYNLHTISSDLWQFPHLRE